MAQPLYFPSNRGRSLYGVLSPPRSGAARDLGIVLCPPFADEAVHAYRPLVEFASVLAGEGFPALLFDYGGTGESEGRFEDATLETYVDDICQATRFLRERCSRARCALLGLRLGGNLAAWAAATTLDDSPLLLWAPLRDLRANFRSFLRRRLFTEVLCLGRPSVTTEGLLRELTAGTTVDVQGYRLSPAMAQDFLTREPFPAATLTEPVLTVEINPSRPGPAPTAFAHWKRVTAHHMSHEPFWELARATVPDQLYALTLEWLAHTFPSLAHAS